MKYYATPLLLFASLLLVFASCEKLDLPEDVPNCIENKIKDIQSDKVWNPPAQVWKWEVDQTVYYYITSDCCDQYNLLYDTDCVIVCAPDGGFAGTGDGNCPSFEGEVVQTLIWEDDRK